MSLSIKTICVSILALCISSNALADTAVTPSNSVQSPILGITPYPAPTYYSISNDNIKLFLDEKDWKNKNFNEAKYFSNSQLQMKAEDQLQFAWEIVEGVSVSFNLFEDSINFNQQNQPQQFSGMMRPKSLSLNSFSPTLTDGINRQVSGYKLGVESEMGLGEKYKLGLNVDFGQIYGADLLGFNNKEISTTSFGVGIRNSSFGASINTDIYLENMEANLNQSRMGFELDWHFSENGKLSFGSKKRIDSTVRSQSSIDDFTGNVQYIKFQHNL